MEEDARGDDGPKGPVQYVEGGVGGEGGGQDEAIILVGPHQSRHLVMVEAGDPETHLGILAGP